MKDHFNNASSGFSYKNSYRKRSNADLWEYSRINKYNKNLNTWSSTITNYHKGFGDVTYKTIIEQEAERATAYLAELTASINIEELRQKSRAERNAKLASDAVNKACAEALAESTAGTPPSLFRRLFGKREP